MLNDLRFLPIHGAGGIRLFPTPKEIHTRHPIAKLPMMTHPRRSWLAVGAILVVAVTLRFEGLTSRGILDYDEAWYLLEAKTLYNTGRYALAQIGWLDLPDADVGLTHNVGGIGQYCFVQVLRRD